MKGAAKEQESAEKRLKFLRNESKSTTMLRERDIFYGLPDGRRVEAVLLPTEKNLRLLMACLPVYLPRVC